MFKALLEVLGDYSVVLVKYLVRIITITLGSLGFVYVFDRMLGFKWSNRIKNTLAIFSNVFFSYCITVIYYAKRYSTFRLVYETIIFALIACVFYVIFAWRLYSRVDYWLDNKGFKDILRRRTSRKKLKKKNKRRKK